MIVNRRLLGFVVLLSLALALTGIFPAGATPPHQSDSFIEYDTVVTGQLSEDSIEDVWVFNGQANDRIMINMRATSPELDTYLTLIDPFGNTLFNDDDSGEGFNSRIGPVELSDSGEYTILAGRYGGVGSYALELSNLNAIPTIAPDKPLRGVVTNEQPTNFFLIETPPDNALTLWRIEVQDDQLYSDPHLAVLGPNGIISSTEAQAETGYLDPVVPIAGEAYVIMVSWNETNAGGPYEIVLRNSELELLTDGTTQNGELDFERMHQSHYFHGEAGQQVQITVRTTNGISPALEVRSIDYSTYLIYTEGSYVRDISITLEIPQTTLYMVDVRNASLDANEGTYTVELTIVDD